LTRLNPNLFIVALFAAVFLSGCAAAEKPAAVPTAVFNLQNHKVAALDKMLEALAADQAARDLVRHFICRTISFQVVVEPRVSPGYGQFDDSTTVGDSGIPVDLSFIGCSQTIDRADLAVVIEEKSFFGSDSDTLIRDYVWRDNRWIDSEDYLAQLLQKGESAEASQFRASMRKVSEAPG
jgi:outer membrane murein-binding lipoprotein Lpp